MHLVSQKRSIAEIFRIVSVISRVSFCGCWFLCETATDGANEMRLMKVPCTHTSCKFINV